MRLVYLMSIFYCGVRISIRGSCMIVSSCLQDLQNGMSDMPLCFKRSRTKWKEQPRSMHIRPWRGHYRNPAKRPQQWSRIDALLISHKGNVCVTLLCSFWRLGCRLLHRSVFDNFSMAFLRCLSSRQDSHIEQAFHHAYTSCVSAATSAHDAIKDSESAQPAEDYMTQKRAECLASARELLKVAKNCWFTSCYFFQVCLRLYITLLCYQCSSCSQPQFNSS